MISIKEIRKVETIEDLENLGIGKVYYDISYRGGGIGFYGSDVARFFDVEEFYLPSKFGAGCNYLGGGVRGSIFPSDFNPEITGRKAKLLNELANACVRVYENIENENNLNDEEDEDGEINWEAVATNSARKAKIISAY